MVRHLLHIGYPKTGSVFLRRWFRGHPQLAYEERTIAGYRDVHHLVREAVVPHESRLYRVTSCEEFSGPRPDAAGADDKQHYSYDVRAAQADICRSLAALLPDAHVVIVTRGFRSMIFSSYSQYVRAGGERTLEEYLRPTGIADPWQYDQLIRMYQEAFGDDHVTVLPYELLRDDPERFVRTLEDRLGLDHFMASSDRVNQSLSPTELYWYPRLSRVIQKLPLGARMKSFYAELVYYNRFWRLIAMLQRIFPTTPVTQDAIPAFSVEGFRGRAESLRSHPLYAPYAADYLIGTD